MFHSAVLSVLSNSKKGIVSSPWSSKIHSRKVHSGTRKKICLGGGQWDSSEAENTGLTIVVLRSVACLVILLFIRIMYIVLISQLLSVSFTIPQYWYLSSKYYSHSNTWWTGTCVKWQCPSFSPWSRAEVGTEVTAACPAGKEGQLRRLCINRPHFHWVFSA